MADSASFELRERIGKKLSPIANESLDEVLANHKDFSPEQMLCCISHIVATAYFAGYDRGYQRGFKIAEAKNEDNNV